MFPTTSPTFKNFSAALLLCVALAGCKSAQDKALDQAKATAASSGQAQQFQVSDGKGNLTTTVVQPPDPTTHAQAVTTTTAPAPTGTTAPAEGVVATTASAPPAANGAMTGPSPAAGEVSVVKPADVRIPSGTSLAIRINQHISVKTSQPGDRFTGEVAESVRDKNNGVIVPRGTHVSGVIDASHRRGHFKGASILELRLTNMRLAGVDYPLETAEYARTKKGKGKRSAAIIGGGAGAGMLIGGIATGGVGLLIGGLAGGGAGTAVAGLTGNRDIEIPAESLVRFQLAEDLTVAAPTQ